MCNLNFTASGYYMYLETSSPRKVNDTARLISKRLSPTKDAGLSFWYHMYGQNVDTLRVLLKKGVNETIIWSKQGNQSNQWIAQNLTFESQDYFQVN